VNGTAQRETPHVGIFWVAQTTAGEARLLGAGCPMGRGDCLTYGVGHYGTWAQWRRNKTMDPALRTIVRSYEYEDWPRGRIVFDGSCDLFVLYADRKLLTPAMIAPIETQFHLHEDRTEVKSDLHYQITEIVGLSSRLPESRGAPVHPAAAAILSRQTKRRML
jgi:hypothetical protein